MIVELRMKIKDEPSFGLVSFDRKIVDSFGLKSENHLEPLYKHSPFIVIKSTSDRCLKTKTMATENDSI